MTNQPSKDKAKATDKDLCGHVNMHALGDKSSLLKPKCTLARGHKGNVHTDGTHNWHSAASINPSDMPPAAPPLDYIESAMEKALKKESLGEFEE